MEPIHQAVNASDSIQIAENSIVSKQIIKKEGANITLFAVAEGEGLTEHTSPFDAFVHVIDGKADISISGVNTTVRTGEYILMPANIPHAVKAVEDFKMLLVMVK